MAELDIERIKKRAKKLKQRVDELEGKTPKKNIRAIAINYDYGKGKAPRIVATGKGNIAKQILELAEEHKVPLYEDEDLTELLSKLDLDVEIPPQLFTLVAEVLAVVYQMNKIAKRKVGLSLGKANIPDDKDGLEKEGKNK